MIEILLISVLLSCYEIAIEMVAFHQNSHPIDRPAYVRGSIIKKFFSGMFWPLVTKMNQELGWFFSNFIGCFIVFTVFFVLTENYMPITLSAIVFCIARNIHLLNQILIIPLSLASTLVWLLVAQPLGAKIPKAMIRMYENK